ncbi:cubilin-like [Galendromus occidentalis]|uniref:Cubilin-like n=1 Tax=Galendromus occidentalis TaxID=34638 RepID=A0AAJ7SHF2_9ACAR|nr:cubilin-like [Galendromus occidentalis]
METIKEDCGRPLEQCDRMFISTPEGARNGTFSAPHMDIAPRKSGSPNRRESSTGGAGNRSPVRQCLYTFIAQPGERVDVTFTTFRVRGTPPECNHEYLDIYSEVQDPAADLIESPFGGRFCGRIYPRRRISVYRTLVISFYTDFPNDTANVFRGTYEFINASRFILGTPASPGSICSFNIHGSQKREGDFYSPTYPGVYPKNLDCQYRFIGTKGQRIRLEFMDFDLSFGGSHCPFDTVKVYDGPDDGPGTPLIGTYCGQQRSLEVFSSAETLFVRFRTLKRQADSQNRGFAGWFEFSEKFAKLDFISENGEHIRGSECDQKILSRKESTGTVYSPNWPLLYTASVVCKYFIYGLEDAQHLEKVRLNFEKVDINASDAECSDAFVKVYLQGQEERGEMESFDHAFCGDTVPPPLRSEGPRLMLVFSSANTQGQGFKATYTFETDYKIPGTPSPGKGCYFSYVSESQLSGEFNSPRYPSNYPSRTMCEYVFLGKPDEQVKIVFKYFRTRSDSSTTQYNDGCEEDWLEIYEQNEKGQEKKYGRYCSSAAPGPIVTDLGYHTVRVVLHTDDQGVAGGFSANYYFLKNVTRYGDCGLNVTGLDGGILTSPGYPENYKNDRQLCNWWITVKPKRRIHFYFTMFHVEGEPTDRGCPSAVVRVWPDPNGVGPPVELCGETLTNETREIMSTGNTLKVQFMTAAKAVGNRGFKAVWSEIRDDDEHCSALKSTSSAIGNSRPFAGGVRCAASSRCISAKLVCNGVANCGPGDDSDEVNCMRSSGMNLFIVTIAASFFVAGCTLLMICASCTSKRSWRGRTRLMFPPAEEDDSSPHPAAPNIHYSINCMDDV